MTNFAVTSFNAGLLSPQIDSRADVDKYASGCRVLDNMIPRIYGGVERRPGTKYIANTIDNAKKSILVPFAYSSTVAYIVEFGDLAARFYYNGAVVGSDIVTPYVEADLPQLQFKQSADVLWIVHPSYAPRKLSRTSATVFELSEIAFEKGPFLPRNDLENGNDVTMYVSSYAVSGALLGASGTGYFQITSATDLSSLFPANKRFHVSDSSANDGAYTVHATTAASYSSGVLTIKANESIPGSDGGGHILVAGGTGAINASAGTFDSGHEGALFKLTQNRVLTDTSGSKAATGVIGVAVDVKDDFNFNTHGTWAGTVELQRNEDGTNWETFRTYVGNSDRNIQYSGTEDADDVQYRINVTAYTSGTIYADLTVNTSTQDAIVRIDTVNNSTNADITFLTACPSTTATKRWYEGAWSASRGYPTAFTFFEDRAVYAGTVNNAQTVWLSETGDYQNFEEGVKDADSFELVLPEADAVRWIESLEALVVGTTGGEWRIRSSTLDAALTPTNFSVRQQTSYGSKQLQALKVNDAVLFVDCVGRKVREMTYLDERQKYVAPDLTALSEHVTEGTIRSIAYQRNPDLILWVVLDDGTLLSMTYEREQDVVAWAQHTLGGDGLAESVAIIPGTAEDEIWLTVSRDSYTGTVRFLEQMQPRIVANQEDMWFVDAGIIYDGAAATTFTGLDHLDYKTVAVLGDGAVFATEYVESGSITINNAVSKAIIGLPYRYKVKPMRLDVRLNNGATHGSYKKISELVISFYNTLNAKYGNSVDELFSIPWRDAEDYTNPPVLFTGDKVVAFDGGFDPDDPILISGNDPLPCTVRAIVARMDQTGR